MGTTFYWDVIGCDGTTRESTGRRVAALCKVAITGLTYLAGSLPESSTVHVNAITMKRAIAAGADVYAVDMAVVKEAENPSDFQKLLAQHLADLEAVFTVLDEHRLLTKGSKCDFFQDRLEFLGHVNSEAGVEIDPKKLDTVKEWHHPTNITELQRVPFTWGEKEHAAFSAPKNVICSPPVRCIADPQRPFEVVTDASDIAIGATVLQDFSNGLQPIAYESRKLHPFEKNYPIHDREMLAIVHPFKVWRCYLTGADVTLRTYHKSLQYLRAQPHLNPRQIRWLDFLESSFHYTVTYKKGASNIADALTRPTAQIHAILLARTSPLLTGLFTHGYQTGPFFTGGNSQQFAAANGEAHDGVTSGHFGVEKTRQQLQRYYYWPEMLTDVQRHVALCPTFQLTKSSRKRPAGQLQPIPPPERAWQHETMDFVTGLPAGASGNDTILVVIDRLTKMVHFAAFKKSITAEEAARLFISTIVRLHGIAAAIISDRDMKFTNNFWRNLWQHFGTRLQFSSSAAPVVPLLLSPASRPIHARLSCFCPLALTHASLFSSLQVEGRGVGVNTAASPLPSPGGLAGAGGAVREAVRTQRATTRESIGGESAFTGMLLCFLTGNRPSLPLQFLFTTVSHPSPLTCCSSPPCLRCLSLQHHQSLRSSRGSCRQAKGWHSSQRDSMWAAPLPAAQGDLFPLAFSLYQFLLTFRFAHFLSTFILAAYSVLSPFKPEPLVVPQLQATDPFFLWWQRWEGREAALHPALMGWESIGLGSPVQGENLFPCSCSLSFLAPFLPLPFCLLLSLFSLLSLAPCLPSLPSPTRALKAVAGQQGVAGGREAGQQPRKGVGSGSSSSSSGSTGAGEWSPLSHSPPPLSLFPFVPAAPCLDHRGVSPSPNPPPPTSQQPQHHGALHGCGKWSQVTAFGAASSGVVPCGSGVVGGICAARHSVLRASAVSGNGGGLNPPLHPHAALLRAALLADALLPSQPCCAPPCCLRRPAVAHPAARSSAGRRPPSCTALLADALLVDAVLAASRPVGSRTALPFPARSSSALVLARLPACVDTWLDNLHLYLLSDSRDSVPLFDHTSGASLASPATADSATRSQWLTRDAVARLAVCNHLPLAERILFGQRKTVKTLYDALVACYSSSATTALGRLKLPYLFPELSAFATVQDLVTHLRTSDARYRAALPAEFLDRNPSPMYITFYFIVTRLPDSLRTVKDRFLALNPTYLTVNLLEKYLLATETNVVAIVAARGTPRTPFFDGYSPFPLAPSYVSTAAVDILGAEDVGAASDFSGKCRNSKGKGGKSGGSRGDGGGGSGGGGGGGGGGSGERCGGSGGFGGSGDGNGGDGGGGGGSSGSGGGGNGGDLGGAVQIKGSGGGQRHVGRLEIGFTARMSFARVTALVRHAGSFTHSTAASPALTPLGAQCLVTRLSAPGGQLLMSGIDIFALDYDAILAVMYTLSVNAEGDCYLCVPPDPSIEVTALDAGESALPGTVLAEALHTFTLDSGAFRCFFRDSFTLTQLYAPVLLRLVDPSGGPVLARSSTVLPCLAVPSSSLSGFHLPSFSMNLVSTAAPRDSMVTTATPGGQRVSICTCTRTGRHLVTFTHRPGSSLYTLTTKPPQVAASGQVSASGPVAAPCSCRLLSHQTLLWHHRLGHPSLPRLCGLHSRLLVSGLPMSLPPLLPLPAPPCLPYVERRQLAAPHSSSFPPTTAPLQTLHMDVRGPARVSGQDRERYFLLIVDDYSRYTTVFPLRSKEVVSSPPTSCETFDVGRAFSIRSRSPASPRENGVAERRIGLVMEVARTSMIHAAAPHFLWSFAVRYIAHQLNLWPRVSLPETSPTLRWMGKVDNALVIWFYNPTSRRVFPSQDVTFDESVPFYGLFLYLTAPLPPPRRSSSLQPIEVAVDSRAARGAASGGVASRGAEPTSAEPGDAEPASSEPGGAEPKGAEPGGAESKGAESRGAEPEGAEPGVTELEGAEPGGAESEGAESGGAEPRGSAAGGTGAGGARDTSLGGAGVTAGAGGIEFAGGAGPGGARNKNSGAGGTGAGGAGAGGARVGDRGAGGAGAGDTGAGGDGARGIGAGCVGDGGIRAGGAGAGGAEAGGTGAVDPEAGGTGAGDPGAGGVGAGGAGAGGTGAGGTVQRRPFFIPPLPSSLPHWLSPSPGS
ncbi:unnamed protein product [Closterium sp. NIES-53]